jgi:hypothetical protein
MKTGFILFFTSLLLLGRSTMSCNRNFQSGCCAEHGVNAKADVVLNDYGAKPILLDIDAYTMSNDNFRTTLWTGTKLQLTLMSIPVGGEVGLEQHND